MSDILSEIDDTLADWHGSADSMRWTPGPVPVGRQPTPEEVRAAIENFNTAMAPVARAMTAQFAAISRAVNEIWLPTARALGLLPPPPPRRSLLDARYRQRQKNRRKRKH